MSKFYEIVRLEEEGPDREDYAHVHRLVNRGWVKKAIEYLSQWDYGSENVGTALYLQRVWDTPTDSRERTDYVVRSLKGYHLCAANACRNGGYAAYYLTREIPESEIPEAA